MIELSSIAKPVEAEAGAPTGEAFTVRSIHEGAAGSAGTDESLASAAFLRVGKSDVPIVPRFVPGPTALETVIRTDERQRILETTRRPWRMICGLRLLGAHGGSAVGTGWLAGPRTIVTAGHCVHYQAFFGGWADRIEVSAGRDDQSFPFGTVTATRFSALNRWIQDGDPDFDIGCIHLDAPLGDTTGYFGFAALPANELESHLVNVSGYPADLAAGRQQYFHANRVLHVSDRRIFYDVDTAGGQSGAPVWIHEEAGGQPLVVAIHAYGTAATPFHLGITANSAPRILPEVFDVIQRWVEADNAGSQEDVIGADPAHSASCE